MTLECCIPCIHSSLEKVGVVVGVIACIKSAFLHCGNTTSTRTLCTETIKCSSAAGQHNLGLKDLSSRLTLFPKNHY